MYKKPRQPRTRCDYRKTFCTAVDRRNTRSTWHETVKMVANLTRTRPSHPGAEAVLLFSPHLVQVCRTSFEGYILIYLRTAVEKHQLEIYHASSGSQPHTSRNQWSGRSDSTINLTISDRVFVMLALKGTLPCLKYDCQIDKEFLSSFFWQDHIFIWLLAFVCFVLFWDTFVDMSRLLLS